VGRLIFDLKPRIRYEGNPEGAEEHNAWVREVFAKHHPGVTPAHCTCGYWGDEVLVTCHPIDRKHCFKNVEKRLEHSYREEHKAMVRGRRQFPGPPFDGKGLPKGHCRWCGEPIKKPNGEINLRRTWHPDCLHEYNLHTDHETQRAFIVQRDGPGCADCGVAVGRWQHHGMEDIEERRCGTDLYWLEKYPRDRYPGPFHWCAWNSGLEVDHQIALGLIAHLPDEERRPYFGPDNIKGRCHACHAVKTKEDTRKIRALQKELADAGKSIHQGPEGEGRP
jgi:hypothetical protein